MKTILITAIGGDIAQGIATVINSLDRDYRLIGTDIQNQHGGSLYVEKCFHVPAATDSGYEDAILQVIKSECVDIVIPVSEPELGIWVDSDKLERSTAQWVLAGAKVIRAGLDKLKTNQELNALGIEAPWTVAVQDSSPRSLPCIMKNRLGSGSRDVFILQQQEDIDYYKPRFPDSIYQELLLPPDQEVTVAVYRTRQKKVAVFQMRRKLSGGVTSWVEIIDDSGIKNMCERVAHGFDLQGSMNIQLRLTKSGPRIFEINPRFSSTTLIRHKLGFEDLRWSLDELEGKSVEFPQLPVGKHAVRTFDAVVID